MERIEYRGVRDRSKWGSGPWDNEPDKIQWQDAETGLPCLIVRNHYGALCGYVGVSEGHPYYKKGYDDCPVGVYGGLTYAAGCMEDVSEKEAICHIPGKGEPDHVWWLGFDCLHYMDYGPAYPQNHFRKQGDYRPVAFVEEQCRHLAQQLKEIGAAHDPVPLLSVGDNPGPQTPHTGLKL
jgi:hypothetical protein